MSIYGQNIFIIDESDFNYTIRGINVKISEDEDKELVNRYIGNDIEIINKDWDIFLDEVAQNFYDYIMFFRKHLTEFAPNFNSLQDVRDNLIFKSANYKVKNLSGKIIRSFDPGIYFKNPPDNNEPIVQASITDDKGLKIDRVFFNYK